MDLYGDLTDANAASKEKTPASVSQTKNVKKTSISPRTFPFIKVGQPDLFGDLPATSSGSTATETTTEKRKLDTPSTDEPQQKRISAGSYRLLGFFAERKGEREEMQDSHVLIDDYLPEVPQAGPEIGRLSYYAVFDGHGGSRASKFAAESLHKNLAARFPKGDITKVEADIKKCIVESYKKTDEEFLKEASKRKPSWKDGSTATSVLILNNTCYIANIGDSKAILCRYNESSKKHAGITLTKDHNPVDYEERMRIQKAGGFVKDGRLMGIIEVSRSFGDGPYKKHGITVVPDMKRCSLTKNDKFILIACDGLWKTFDNDAAIKTVLNIVQSDEDYTDSEDRINAKFEQAAHVLAREAVRKLSADNVTVILVRICS